MSTKEQYWKYSLIVIILFMGVMGMRGNYTGVLGLRGVWFWCTCMIGER